MAGSILPRPPWLQRELGGKTAQQRDNDWADVALLLFYCCRDQMQPPRFLPDVDICRKYKHKCDNSICDAELLQLIYVQDQRLILTG